MSHVSYFSAMYIMVCTRLDLSHAVSIVSHYKDNIGKKHWEAVKWVLRYLKATANIGFVFDKNLAKYSNVVGYVYSNYAGHPGKRSSSHYIFTLRNSAVSWKVECIVYCCFVNYWSKIYLSYRRHQRSYSAERFGLWSSFIIVSYYYILLYL